MHYFIFYAIPNAIISQCPKIVIDRGDYRIQAPLVGISFYNSVQNVSRGCRKPFSTLDFILELGEGEMGYELTGGGLG